MLIPLHAKLPRVGLSEGFWSTLWSSNYAYHILFWILGSQESIASNGVRFGFETKKLWPFEDKPRKAKTGIFFDFATVPPFRLLFFFFVFTYYINIDNSMFWCLIFWDWMCYWWCIIYRHHFCLNLAFFYFH